MQVKPFSPEDVERLAAELDPFPSEVIQVVNGLLQERGRSSVSYITIKQDEVLERLEELFKSEGIKFNRQMAFDGHWLDFETAYRSQGWLVEYDKPGYNESYDAHWIFRKKT